MSGPRITALEAFIVPPGWTLVRVEREDGVIGWGEAGVQTWGPAVAAAIGELARVVVGEDAERIELLWQMMHRSGFYRGGAVLSAAIAGIDIALWDAAARAQAVPIHALLGGAVRDRQRVYPWVGDDDDWPDGLAAAARVLVDEGHTALKATVPRAEPLPSPAWLDMVAAGVAALREAVGPSVDLALDFHGRLDAPASKRLLPLIEPFGLLFVEEPVLPDQPDALRSLTVSSRIPIAAGERLYSRADVARLLPGGLDILQPDVAQAGGISETRRIAAFAEAYGVPVAPHCAIGPIAVAASLQVCLATPNALIAECDLAWSFDDASRVAPDLSPLAAQDGYVARTARPGLGVEVDEVAVRAAHDPQRAWRPPRWRSADGSVQEW